MKRDFGDTVLLRVWRRINLRARLGFYRELRGIVERESPDA